MSEATTTTNNDKSPPDPGGFLDICNEWHKAMDKAQRFNRLLNTDAAIAQTPKQLIWTLNKAKLYRYTPVVPESERKPIPLLMVFAIMNRPHVLDLRQGHSFVEYMLKNGYDLYLLDWGAPGPEDQNVKFDDYALEYLPRVIRKLKNVSGSKEFSMLGWCLGALDQHPVRRAPPQRRPQEPGVADRAARLLRQDRRWFHALVQSRGVQPRPDRGSIG